MPTLPNSAPIVESDRTFLLRLELAESREYDRIVATYPLCDTEPETPRELTPAELDALPEGVPDEALTQAPGYRERLREAGVGILPTDGSAAEPATEDGMEFPTRRATWADREAFRAEVIEFLRASLED